MIRVRRFFARDSHLWRVFFYGAGLLWAALLALNAFAPEDLAACGIPAIWAHRIDVILAVICAVGGKLGLSPLSKEREIR